MSWNLGEDDWNGGSDEDSDEGDNYSESKFRNLKSHTIYAVDASSNMFKKLARTVHAPADRPGHAREEQTEDSSPFYMVMEGLRSGLSESIILSPNDLTGIILYNVRKNSNSMSFDHIYVTMNLSTPGASDLASVEALRDLALRDEGPKFQQHFGSADNMVDISNVLFVARDIFDSCTTAKQGRKKVIFYTCNDDPQSGMLF
ncbi:hypothetical protein SARC_09676 [Sphaeroforma arctica JP610]|uniref:Ku70/Ku80 N-terminal alpha/beta domain-containing protein n=1 Tax=Sphaeroforma arctica JP610 TaxID=667725 RepID=A0A0L0FMZ4_9EUKA|nr:hypothetical protein SARC_09676 [Sphaeroforma arctica JP610]KNC77876.1 hypothetical protein SARC_09676 [Sphaeroforma arctica JP610]|eukprot:XP_014151778.1 hypothetical protein SARC_09676 [Sphaeroforma arctica JP610]